MWRKLRNLWIALGVLGAAAAGTAALASQANLWSPNTGTVSGLTLTNNYNAALSALATCNSGATAPANDISGVPVKGQCWLDTSNATLNIKKRYDGTSWLIEGYFDLTNHLWVPIVGGGVPGGPLTSASTTDLCSVSSSLVGISGSVAITSFGSTCQVGQQKNLYFNNAIVLTQSAALLLPNGGSNITTAVGDRAIAYHSGSGNWTVLSYMKVDGTAISTSAVFTSTATFSGVISPAALSSGTTDDYNPTGLSGAETLRLTPNASHSTRGGGR